MISLVIPVYNVEKYLAVCIESCINQTNSDWEMILVDDGSTDSSLDICKEYEKKDSRIKVVHQENKGLSGARNTGVKNAKGEYIFFVDSDDCLDCNCLKVLSKLAEYTKSPLIQINLKFVPEDFKPEQNNLMISIVDNDLKMGDKTYTINKFDTIDAFYNLDKDNKKIAEDIRLTTTVAWTKLYRLDAYKALLFPEEVRLHEDQMTSHRRIVEAKGMVFVDIPLYFYRQANNASLIRVGWSPKRLAILDCYDDRLETVKQLCSEDKTDRSKELLNYIYLRTMVCYFRNYCMVVKNVKDKTAINYKKDIIARMKKHIKNKAGKLTLGKKFLFNAFVIWPYPFAKAFIIRNK